MVNTMKIQENVKLFFLKKWTKFLDNSKIIILITIRINYKDIEKLIIGLKDAKDVFVYRKYNLFLAVVLKYLSHDNNCFSFYFKLLHTEQSSTYDDLIK